MTPGEVVRVVSFLRAAFRVKDFDDATLAVWTESLKPYRAEAAEQAARNIIEDLDRFPSIHEMLMGTQASARDIAKAERELGIGETSRCPECDGSTWVTTDDARPTTVRPCERCNPEGYRRWEEGHWMPNHDCAECRSTKGRGKGRRKKEPAE